MTLILKSKPVIDETFHQLKSDCETLTQRFYKPTLNVILVGNNPASQTYVRNKKKFCESFGAFCKTIHLPENIERKTFLETVAQISADPQVHGILIQLPLPKHLSDIDTSILIPAAKDVDGFHPDNIFHLFAGSCGEKGLLPCTPLGTVSLLKHYNIPIEGKNVCVIGRSHIVGKPAALLYCNLNATVDLCHSKTTNLEQHIKSADIVIAAVGKARFLSASYFRSDCSQTVIDVGTNFDQNGKLCGDVDMDSVAPHVHAISPVPGGVGPLTILSLAQNLIRATRSQLA